MSSQIATWTSGQAFRIKSHLSHCDSTLAEALKPLGLIKPEEKQDPYLALVQSIIAQQLSVRAAETIQTRVFELFPRRYPDSALMLRKRDQSLRKAGLSLAKIKTLKGAACYHQSGGLDPSTMRTQLDQEIIQDVTQIWGVGVWTVQMLLMFSMNRADVFPVHDVGIQNAMKRLYKLNQKGKELHIQMEAIADQWRPYRSAACRYLWRWLHTTAFEPASGTLRQQP